MSLTAKSPAARARWLEQYALPKAQELKGRRLTSKPMADLLSVSWNTLRGWTRSVPDFEASGAFEGGAEGIAYAFKPVATVRFLIKHFQAEADKRAAKAKQISDTIGAQTLGGAPSDMTLDEIKKAVEVRSSMIRQEQIEGRLVDKSVVENAVSKMFDKMTQVGLSAAREQDPTGQWSVEMAERFESAIETIIIAMQAAGQECLNELERAGPVT